LGHQDHQQSLSELIDSGESSTLEFKSSLRWDYQQVKINKDLAKAVVKTLGAFLNSKGGTLLIGVTDGGDICGIEPDIATISKKSNDGLELALRDAIKTHLGAAIDTNIDVAFIPTADKHVVRVDCAPHPEPVYFHDGGDTKLFVRAGNRTSALDVRSAMEYARTHWARSTLSEDRVKSALREVLESRTQLSQANDSNPRIPIWLQMSTTKVLDLYLHTLSRAYGWKRLNIISPWISEFDDSLATMTFTQLLRRLTLDNATAYVVTRPPVEDWHHRAISMLAETGRANIAFVPQLHVKLFTAQTAQSSFAMMGSANFTRQSLKNRELGILISGTGDGIELVRNLNYEASEIYRHPDRKLMCRADLSMRGRGN
jgi:hypothetical protein